MKISLLCIACFLIPTISPILFVRLFQGKVYLILQRIDRFVDAVPYGGLIRPGASILLATFIATFGALIPSTAIIIIDLGGDNPNMYIPATLSALAGDLFGVGVGYVLLQRIWIQRGQTRNAEEGRSIQ